MDLMDGFEKNMQINRWIEVLDMGAKKIGPDMRISQVFSDGKLFPQLPSFFAIKGITLEAKDAINWWVSLSPEEQSKYDR